jgi:CBS domain-containing protein
MLQAQNIMKRDLATLKPQDTLDKAIELLVERNITGIPVINEDQTLAGIITEKDILAYMLEQDAVTRLTDSNLCEHTVYHAMTEKVVTFQEETPLSEICECLARHEFRRVPILSPDGKLAGIISRKDIIAVIS